MLQYKIPQNVEVEDKIVGPLTMRQLVICGVGFGIAYVLYISLIRNYYIEIWGPPVVLISLLTIAIAFVEIRHISFTKWALLMIEAMINPHKRIWDKQDSSRFLWATLRTAPEKELEKEAGVVASEEKAMKSLSEAAKSLDTFSDPIRSSSQKGDHETHF